ncbi:MAG TPA: glutamine--fructose-6-phosphate transaminase (isomerizing) [Candidatus Omnitrophica bacterium]|nr:MAG: glutamine--fructose-6-phosphate aminotransferase [Omnitrophica WOR_2 bacterium GWA2_45_18]HBR14085.1 glutamine--fructose-6-phosphate transaminase (isomerizing) [Candidatus Omnitrophota bacterium]
MCGIVGYVGEKQAVPILLESLKKLEYRGYDSSGVGVIALENGKVHLRKTQGKIQNLQDLIKSHSIPRSSIGICHTRWATHGVPNRVNAHPHTDCTGKILIVHNGIIENYAELKAALQKRNHKFTSDTDTEVIAHLIEESYDTNLELAVQKAIAQLKGTFALGVICADYPDTIIAARVGSPLIIGLGHKENFIASDVPAILEATKKIIYLKDGQMARLTKEAVKVFTFAGEKVSPKVNTITFSVEAVQKQGYAHFMLKEIHEQPDVIEQMCQSRLKDGHVHLDGIRLKDKQLKAVSQIVIVACGTAYHAGLVGKYCIEHLSGIRVSVDVSSEFRYRDPIVDKRTLVVAISQSGETADTLAAVREAKSKGAKVIAICNVVGSSLVRESDGVLYTHAGPEIGVASTKAYTAQLGMLYLLALKLSALKDKVSSRERQDIIQDFRRIPRLFEMILKAKKTIAVIAKKNSHFGCFLFLGRNINYPSALEGALKLKEISYIPAEGYAAGEMKHGPIALIDEYRAVVCITPQSETYDKMISNMQEIRARKGKIIAIATEGNEAIKQHAHHVVYVPQTNNILTPLLVALPLQLIAYYIAVHRGCDVDQPRNLAKSVTVE